MKSYLASLVVALLAVPAAAAPLAGHVRADASSRPSSGPQSANLLVVVHCDQCGADADPAVTFLWRRVTGSAEPTLRGVRTLDWSIGSFELVDSAGNRAVQGTSVAGGWAVEIVVPDGKLPFRTQAVLRGYTARRGVYWPGSDVTPRNDFHFEPVADILARHPTWDPQQGDECEVTIPKTATMPVTFLASGEPRAWLFPALRTEGAATGEWTFQFAKPGQSILERMEATVMPVDDGSAWTVRLPLVGVLGRSLPQGGAPGIASREDVAVASGSLRAKAEPVLAPEGSVGLDAHVEDAPPVLLAQDGRGPGAGATIDVTGCPLTLP